jgi:hypothetical protein
MPWSRWPAAPWRAGDSQPLVGCGPSCWSPWTWPACWGPGGVGGDTDAVGPLDPEACRRLACDGAVTRVVVTRHPPDHPGTDERLAAKLQAAARLLPRPWAGPRPSRWRWAGPAGS